MDVFLLQSCVFGGKRYGLFGQRRVRGNDDLGGECYYVYYMDLDVCFGLYEILEYLYFIVIDDSEDEEVDRFEFVDLVDLEMFILENVLCR